MSTLTLAPITVIFTGSTMSEVYEQITQYVAKNADKHLDSLKETAIPTIPIHHYVPAPAPAPAPKENTLPAIPGLPIPAPTLTPKERVIQDLKAALEKCKTEGNTLFATEYMNILKHIDTDPSFNPYITLISNKKYDLVYDTLFNSILDHYYDSMEASATQKEKVRKAGILATLQEKFNSYPPEKTWQRASYKQVIEDVTNLPSNTDDTTYINLKGVGNSISRVIIDAYSKYN